MSMYLLFNLKLPQVCIILCSDVTSLPIFFCHIIFAYALWSIFLLIKSSRLGFEPMQLSRRVPYPASPWQHAIHNSCTYYRI